MPRRLMLLAILLLAGCSKQPAKLAPSKAIEVLITSPTIQSVTEYEEFTGRIEAEKTVELRSRVTGYLEKSLFRDGSDVVKGDVLFEVDPRTYKAEFERATANLALAEAHLTRLETDYLRAMNLQKTNALSQEEFDKIAGDRNEAMAAVGVAKAGLDVARTNLTYTKIEAPISGRISRTMIDAGNLVKADDTLLTVIVTKDPMFAYFDVDERTLLRLRRLVQAGKIRSARENSLPIEAGLTDEEGYSMGGTIDFIDNRLVANSGTLRVRGVFANPKGLLSPGLFVRIRMPVGDPRQAVCIPEQALSTDQGQKYVYVVDDKNVVQYRRVKTGPLQEGMRAIEDGIKKEDRVVVGGLQRIRPGATVDPKPATVAAANP